MNVDRARTALVAARAFLPERPKDALALCREVAQLAAQVGDHLLEADAELGWGESLYVMDGRERDCLPHLRRAAVLAPGTGTAAMALMTVGDALGYLGEFEGAVVAYADAAEAFAGLRDAFGECLVRQAWAGLLIARGRGEEALPQLERAAACAVDSDEPGRASELRLTSGEVLLDLRRGPEAVVALETAAKTFQQMGDRRQEMRARGKLIVALNLEAVSRRPVPYNHLIRMAELMAELGIEDGDAELEGASQFMLAQLLAEATDGARDDQHR